MQTLQHIPIWVFVLFIGLMALGLHQTRTRHIRRRRLLSIHVALTVVTLAGVTLQWWHTPWLGLSLLSWTGTCLLATWLISQGQASPAANYNPNTQRFTVPGSWVPLCLFMAIFACKFVVGMLNATTPNTLHTVGAAIGISALYGLFSGVLNGRARRLIQLEKHDMKVPLPLRSLLSLIAGLLIASTTFAQVGMRQIHAGNMPITLVYPTAEISQSLTQGAFTLQVAINAPLLAATTGKRRLIVFSHGTAGSSMPDHDLAATLARAGFVVAQPLHRGDNYLDFSKAGPESWKTRPQDVSDTLDAIANDEVLGLLINTQKVGVHGMSAGGVTGLVLAGAQWRMLNLVTHCAQHLEEDIGFCLNGLAAQPLQQAIRKGRFAMARVLSETHAPADLKALHGGQSDTLASNPHPDSRPDSRITAVSLLVPVGVIFTPESLARIAIPVGLTTSESDLVLAPQWHSSHVLQHCKTCTKLSNHSRAGHFDWLSPWPASIAQTVAATQMRGGLPDARFSDEERQKAFEKIALFFKQTL